MFKLTYCLLPPKNKKFTGRDRLYRFILKGLYPGLFGLWARFKPVFKALKKRKRGDPERFVWLKSKKLFRVFKLGLHDFQTFSHYYLLEDWRWWVRKRVSAYLSAKQSDHPSAKWLKVSHRSYERRYNCAPAFCRFFIKNKSASPFKFYLCRSRDCPFCLCRRVLGTYFQLVRIEKLFRKHLFQPLVTVAHFDISGYSSIDEIRKFIRTIKNRVRDDRDCFSYCTYYRPLITDNPDKPKVKNHSFRMSFLLTHTSAFDVLKALAIEVNSSVKRSLLQTEAMGRKKIAAWAASTYYTQGSFLFYDTPDKWDVLQNYYSGKSSRRTSESFHREKCEAAVEAFIEKKKEKKLPRRSKFLQLQLESMNKENPVATVETP